jgi:hypothetical protein
MIEARYRLDRPLTRRERDVLRHLLLGRTDSAPYLTQVDSLRALGRCPCGCASIIVGQNDAPSIEEAPLEVVAEGTGSTDNDEPFDLLVFARGRRLHELELVWYGDGEAPRELPSPERIKDRW